ncbi:hypothetical protein, partial [Plasmodium yoelii yoelii]
RLIYLTFANIKCICMKYVRTFVFS